jgi:adenylate kinase family enzyme
MSKNTVIISAFPGCGKSTAFTKLKKKINILDSDSSTFDKSDFPNNYIKHMKDNIGVADIIFISSHETVRKALKEENIYYTIYYPSKYRKQEFLELYKQRGNNENFIKLLDENFNNFIDSIENDDSKDINKIKLMNEGDFIGTDEMFNNLLKTIK